MKIILSFDIYGTLIDTNGVVVYLQQIIGGRSVSFSNTWRDTQL